MNAERLHLVSGPTLHLSAQGENIPVFLVRGVPRDIVWL